MISKFKYTEYELIDIEWSLDYDFTDDAPPPVIRDDAGEPSEVENNEIRIQYDADGIPMGQSMEEIRIRQQIIQQYWNEWKSSHPQQVVFNDKIQEDILLRSISITEAKEHSAKSYRSTCAFLRFEEIISHASPVGRTPVKKGNSNQSEFESMLVMVYREDKLGTVKITVGIRLRPNKNGYKEKVQYGISSLEEGQTLMPPKEKKGKNKKASHRK